MNSLGIPDKVEYLDYIHDNFHGVPLGKSLFSVKEVTCHPHVPNQQSLPATVAFKSKPHTTEPLISEGLQPVQQVL